MDNNTRDAFVSGKGVPMAHQPTPAPALMDGVVVERYDHTPAFPMRYDETTEFLGQLDVASTDLVALAEHLQDVRATLILHHTPPGPRTQELFTKLNQLVSEWYPD